MNEADFKWFSNCEKLQTPQCTISDKNVPEDAIKVGVSSHQTLFSTMIKCSEIDSLLQIWPNYDCIHFMPSSDYTDATIIPLND